MENELIKVTVKDDQQLVLARDLYKGVHNNLKWTQKGKKFIYDLLKEYNVHPVLERMDLLEG